MPNYELKSQLLKENNKLRLYRYYSNVKYRFIYKEDVSLTEYQFATSFLSNFERNEPVIYKELSLISHAHFERVNRLRNRIANMVLYSDCIFLTLTFTNEVLSKTNSYTRRQKVYRFLKSLNIEYVANIDFGKKNNREHYHALIATDNINYALWNYGLINGQKIRNQTDDLNRLSKYVAKLTNHAIKETTKRCAIIYSRNKRSF